MVASLKRSLALALLFKLAALITLWALFFSPSHRVKPTPAQMTSHFSAAALNHEATR